jgi:hypothetical protein
MKFCLQDDSVTWVETNPDFTFCFKQTALIWAPCAFLALFTLLDVYLRSKSRYSNIPWSLLNLSKSLALLLLISLTFYDLAMMLSVRSEPDIDIYDVQVVSVSVKAGTFVSVSDTFLALISYENIFLDTCCVPSTAAQDERPSNIWTFVSFLADDGRLCNPTIALGTPELRQQQPQLMDAIPVSQLHHILLAHHRHVVFELLR